MIKRGRRTRKGTIKVTFSLPSDDPAGQVSVVGDFNDWQPGTHELVGTNGVRTASVELPIGSTHRFRYLAADGVWFDDSEADAHDEHGSLINT